MSKKWEKDQHSDSYTNLITPNLIREIEFRSSDKDGIDIVVFAKPIATCERSKALYDELNGAGFEQGDFHRYTAGQRSGFLKDHALLCKFLRIIKKYEGIPFDEYCQMLSNLNIKITEEDFVDEVSSFVEKGDFQAAIKLAQTRQDEGYHEIIWELSTTLHENDNIEPHALVELYNCILEKNPHYVEAQERLGGLYLDPEVEPDKYRGLELALETALKSNDQKLTDQFFHSLCGRKGLSPTFTNMKGDIHTLVSLATHIRIIEEKLATLEDAPEAEQRKLGLFK